MNTNLRGFFSIIKLKKYYICLKFQSNFLRGVKNHYSSSYNFFSPKDAFFAYKLIIQNYFNLTFNGQHSTINSTHIRQSIIYFCMVKIKNLKHIMCKRISKWDNSLTTSIVKKLLSLE